jgi:hypothetical protein
MFLQVDDICHFLDFFLDRLHLLLQPDVGSVVSERVDEGVVDRVLLKIIDSNESKLY